MTLPYEEEDLRDYIVLGITPSPGIVTLSGHDAPKNWKTAKAKGQTGATSQLEGDDVRSFKATFYLAGDGSDEPGFDDFALWESFRRIIESTTNGPKPFALPVYHPDLAAQGITEVSNGGIGGAVHDGRGGVSYTVTFIEYKPPKPKPVSKAQPGRQGVTTLEKPDPNAAAKAELAALLAEARKP